MSQDEHAAARPATFSEVFASGEYRAVFTASVLSWIGDSIAKAAVTAMVYRQSGSVTLSAAAFAISFLPSLLGGPLLAALAERYPNRRVMVGADLARCCLILLVAVPGMPLPALLFLVFLTALFNPPFDAARSALLPRILSGERYVVAVAVQGTAVQAAIVVGYLGGGALAPFHPRLALVLDAATFAFSAFLIGLLVRDRPAALAVWQRTHLLRETGEGFKVVFGNPVLRAIALLVFATAMVAVVPEGLGAAWAGHLSGDPHRQGWAQGTVMAGQALGFAAGGLVISRLVPAPVRRRLLPLFALLGPVALALALLDPPVTGVAGIGLLCGIAMAGLLPTANGLFVQALPNMFRARAFGIMSAGLQLFQGAAIVAVGAIGRRISVPVAVGAWGVAAAVAVLLAVWALPDARRMQAAIDDAALANAVAEAGAPETGTRTVAPAGAQQAGENNGAPVPWPAAPEPRTATHARRSARA